MKRLLPLVLAVGLLAACADDPTTVSTAAPGASSPAATGTPASSPVPATSAPAAPATPAEPPFPADTEVDVQDPTGEQQTVVAVRAARQDGYDRVVFELDGKGVGEPGWRVEYVDRATQDGSGDDVEVAGEAILSVFVEGSGLPFETGQEEASQDLTPRDTERLREVDLQATFEGRFTAFLGLDRRVPFRVFRLSDPSRVVVDVRHE